MYHLHWKREPPCDLIEHAFYFNDDGHISFTLVHVIMIQKSVLSIEMRYMYKQKACIALNDLSSSKSEYFLAYLIK